MKIPLRKINNALNKELGSKVAELRKGWGKYPYAIHFFADDPPKKTIERAKKIVDRYIPSVWSEEDSRRIG